jgi:pentatricopeptide repeat protein
MLASLMSLWGSSLIAMHAKCGSIKVAKKMFNKMPSRDVTTWSTMILGHCRIHGNAEMATHVVKQICEMKLKNVVGYVMLSNIYINGGNKHICENVEY